MKQVKLFVDGAWRNSSTGETRPIINPATEDVIGALSVASTQDLHDAAAASQRGFAVWRDLGPFARSAVLRKAADLLRERADSIGRDISSENGKIQSEGVAEVMWSAEFLDWCAEEGRRTYGRVVPARLPNVRQSVILEPVGPVLALSPWNWPLVTAVKKIAGALGAGCSVVLKPAEETPSGAAGLAQAFADAGMPAGVFNVVYGTPAHISETLIAAPEIKKISFTGSVPVGVELSVLAARAKKSITTELGGHAPVVVFEDADIDKAVSVTFPFKFRTAGQVCSAPTRMLVHASVANQFAQEFAAAAKALKVGIGSDPASQMGPVISQKRLNTVEQLVKDAVAAGAEIVCGGERIGTRGFFYAPTVLKNVPDEAAIMRDEPFGPLAPIATFTDYDDAVRRANSTEFGLAGYAFTRSLDIARRISRDLDCGVVGINTMGVSMVEAPFGGFKSSGTGKEGGVEGVHAYLRTKYVVEASA